MYLVDLTPDEVYTVMRMNSKTFDELLESEKSLDKNDLEACRRHIQRACNILSSAHNYLYTTGMYEGESI